MGFSQRILPWVVGFALLSCVLAVASNNMIVDLDLFHEMALYRQFVEEGSMPTGDSFAYTPTVERVVHHEWATGAVLYWTTVSTGLGAAGLVALKYALSFAVCLGCWFYARWRGADLATFAFLVPVALNLGGWIAFTNIRAQLFTLLFMVILLFLLELDRRGKRWWMWIWFPTFIVWANMHGGVVSGMGILAVYGLAQWIDSMREHRSVAKSFRKVGHLIFVGIVTALLLNVNPYGMEYTPYLVRAVTMERPLILEWDPIWKSGSTSSQMTMLISVTIAACAVFFRNQTTQRHTFEMIALMLTAYLAMKNLRHGSLYAVTWICLVPPLLRENTLGETIVGIWNRRAPQIAVVSIAVGLVCCGFAVNEKFWKLRIPTEFVAEEAGVPIYPVGAVRFLSENKFEGNVFVPFAAGAYVSWNLYPHVKVSIDSRYEVAYPTGAVEENVAFYRAEQGWQATLEKYNTQALLIPRHEDIFEVLEDTIAESSKFGWRCVFKDNGYAIYFPNDVPEQLTLTDRTGKRVYGEFP